MTNKQHKQMWAEIAEAFYVPERNQNTRQYDIANMGLCDALNYFGIDIEITHYMFADYQMWGEGALVIGSSTEWRLHFKWKLPRGDLAYLFSTMSKREFEELVEMKYPNA